MPVISSSEAAPFFVSIPIWGWCDIGFTLMVLVGICFEIDKIARFIIPEIPSELPMMTDWRASKLKKPGEIILALGIAGEVVCLGISLREAASLNKEASDAKTLAENIGTTNAWLWQSNLVLRTNISDLNRSTIKLAHLYDLSTNALAEANARISSVSNSAAMNSPANFPITSVYGVGSIMLNPGDRVSVDEIRTEVTLNLIKDDDLASPIIVLTGPREFANSSEIVFEVDASNLHKFGPSQLTYNDLGAVRIYPFNPVFPASKRRMIGIKGGFLTLTINSQFEVNFDIPPQTSAQYLILGAKEKDLSEMFPQLKMISK